MMEDKNNYTKDHETDVLDIVRIDVLLRQQARLDSDSCEICGDSDMSFGGLCAICARGHYE